MLNTNAAAELDIANGQTLAIQGPQFTNEGAIVVNPTAGGSGTYIRVNADMTLRLLRLIDRPNVVVNFDPGNMHLASEAYGRAATLRLRPYIGNVQVKEARREGIDGGAGARQPSGPYDVLLGEGLEDVVSGIDENLLPAAVGEPGEAVPDLGERDRRRE